MKLNEKKSEEPEETEGARTYGEKTGNRNRLVLYYYDRTNWTAYVRRQWKFASYY